MSKFYESEGRNAAACDFAGNATLNRGASETETADALASSCVANPSATFAPSAPATTRPASTGAASGRPSGDDSSALGKSALVGVASTALVGAMAAVWTLF
jgi:1,3-beta-glucanosyltransferase GAS1